MAIVASQLMKMEYVIKVAGRVAKIGRTTTPHSMRHSLGMKLRKAGAEIDIIQKILGHRRPDTTQIYVKLSNTQVKEKYDKIMGKKK